MAVGDSSPATNTGKINGPNGSAARMGRANNTLDSAIILSKGIGILPKLPFNSRFFSESSSSTAAAEKRPSYSSVVRRGSLNDKPSDLETTEAFARLSLRMSERSCNRTPAASVNLQPQMNVEGGKPFQRLDNTEGKGASWRVTCAQKSSSDTNLYADRTATIKTAQHGSLKMSFDDVSALPVDTGAAPLSPNNATKKSQLTLGNPEYFVPPKWFPKTSVLYQMCSEPKLSRVRGPPQCGSSSPNKGLGMVPNYSPQIGHFPLVQIVPASSVFHKQHTNSSLTKTGYPSECGSKTPEAAIQEAFLSHYARQQRQPEVDQPSGTARTFSSLLKELSSQADSSFNGLNMYQSVESEHLDDLFEVRSSRPEPSKISSSGNSSNILANATSNNIFDESKSDESELSAVQKLIEFTLFGRKKPSKFTEEVICDKKIEQEDRCESDTRSGHSTERASLIDENGLSKWCQQSEDYQICDSCRYWKKLKAENPNVDISEQLSQRLSAFEKEDQQVSGRHFDRCTRCSRKLMKKVTPIFCEKRAWKQQCNQRGA